MIMAKGRILIGLITQFHSDSYRARDQINLIAESVK